MRYGSFVVAALLALAVAAFVNPIEFAEARPPADELLHVTSRMTYDILPAEGPVRVNWQLELQNNDPSTAYSDFGVSYYYSSVTLPIFSGAESLGASSEGVSLAVGLEDLDDDIITGASITFHRAIFYGDSYSFTLSYELPPLRNEALLITPAYVFLPVLAHGDSSSVTINAPEGAAWDVTIEDADTDPCTKSGATYTCSAADTIVVPAVVEVSRPDALQNLKATIDTPSGAFDVTVRFFPGEAAWAEHVHEITDAALPVLEELFGVPYDGPRTLTIAERGRQDTAGYEGLFDCDDDACEIAISPIASDHTAVHELAHLWTQPYEARWIGEGLAEFMSRRAGERLGSLIAPEPDASFEQIDFPLDDWPAPRFIIGASEDDLRREGTGYAESLRMFEALEEQIGLEAIQQANVMAEEHAGGVGSEEYFDMLEAASSANLDSLFLAEVFPPSHAQVLEQRRATRSNLDTLRARADAAGLNVPETIEADVDAWRFDQANDDIEAAQDALDAYEDARDRVEASRNPWQRIGLIGKDPESQLADARASFRAGSLDEAQQQAGDAADTIDGASAAAAVRVTIALGVIGVLGMFAGGGALLVRRRRRRTAI